MKKLTVFLSLLLAVVLLVGCAGTSGTVREPKPVDELYSYANKLKDNGAFAVVGYGESDRYDLARDKAIADGQRLIGEAMEVRVEGLKKRFIEEVGTEDAEINEFFSQATKILTRAEYSGATMEKTYQTQRKDGKYEFHAVMALNPDIIIKSVDDELKNRKLYERWRASEAFNELEKEIQEYESSQDYGE
ncbi:hypothetical protein M0P98_08515 [bacterium]|nr:hypothetical protein [bacterium]